MKIFNTNLTYQLNGSLIFLILRGKERDVIETHNSLFNLGGTPAFLDWKERGDNSLAIVSSSRQKMANYFYNAHYNKFHDSQKARTTSMIKMADLFNPENKNGEVFIKSFKAAKPISDTFNVGIVKAERPDVDMKDSIMSHAFNDDSKTSKNTVTTERKTVDLLIAEY
jgi:hypothetical protein